MKYYNATKVSSSFEATVAQIRELLADEGFGVITEIDVRNTMKEKLGVDFRPYVILGACNPGLAYKALQSEDKIGVMLPCNVIVQDAPDGIEVAVMDPVAAMGAIGNSALESTAAEVKTRLDRVVSGLKGS